MRKAFGLIGLGLLAGCANTGITPTTRADVPQAVWEHIPANTPVDSIRQGSQDGCYWYMHHGPLESILIPVRDDESVPVCL